MCHIIPYHIYLQYTFSIFPFGSEQNVRTGSHAQLLDYSRFTQPLVRCMIMVKMSAALR